jgi:prevent-host-death family protein
MATIGVRELKQRLSEVLSEVERTGEPVSVTRRGRTVAELRRVETKLTDEEIEAYLAGWDELRESMPGVWPEGVTALDAVLEQRREP